MAHISYNGETAPPSVSERPKTLRGLYNEIMKHVRGQKEQGIDAVIDGAEHTVDTEKMRGIESEKARRETEGRLDKLAGAIDQLQEEADVTDATHDSLEALKQKIATAKSEIWQKDEKQEEEKSSGIGGWLKRFFGRFGKKAESAVQGAAAGAGISIPFSGFFKGLWRKLGQGYHAAMAGLGKKSKEKGKKSLRERLFGWFIDPKVHEEKLEMIAVASALERTINIENKRLKPTVRFTFESSVDDKIVLGQIRALDLAKKAKSIDEFIAVQFAKHSEALQGGKVTLRRILNMLESERDTQKPQVAAKPEPKKEKPPKEQTPPKEPKQADAAKPDTQQTDQSSTNPPTS